MKKIVFIDLDDTIADFQGSAKFKDGFNVVHMYEPGFFKDLPVIPGALVAVRAIMRMGYDVHILTQPLAESAHSYSEKVQWVALHFPDLINKISMTQDKGLFKGDYLIDDNALKWKEKFEANGGKFIFFKNPLLSNGPMPDMEKQWKDIVKFFEEESKDE